MVTNRDAGDGRCRVFAFELRARRESLESSDCLEVIAHDPGEEEIVPSSRRMAGPRAGFIGTPVFVIRREG